MGLKEGGQQRHAQQGVQLLLAALVPLLRLLQRNSLQGAGDGTCCLQRRQRCQQAAPPQRLDEQRPVGGGIQQLRLLGPPAQLQLGGVGLLAESTAAPARGPDRAQAKQGEAAW